LFDSTGIYLEKRAIITSASIPKYVDGIRGCTTQAFPVATIGRISELLSTGKINISNIDIVIFPLSFQGKCLYYQTNNKLKGI
jgi:hypothetical protein